MRNEKEVTTDNAEIQRIIRNSYEQLYAIKWTTSKKWTNSQKTISFQNGTRKRYEEDTKIEDMNRLITGTEIEAVIKKKYFNKQKPRAR